MTASNLTRRAQVLMAGVNALFGPNRNKRALKLGEAIDLLAAADGHRNRHAAIAAEGNGADTPPAPAALASTRPNMFAELSLDELRALASDSSYALSHRLSDNNRSARRTAIETHHHTIPVVPDGPTNLTEVGLRGCVNEVELFLVNCWHGDRDLRDVVRETYERLLWAMRRPTDPSAWTVTRTDMHVVALAVQVENDLWQRNGVRSCYDVTAYQVRPVAEWDPEWVQLAHRLDDGDDAAAIRTLQARRREMRECADPTVVGNLGPIELFELVRDGVAIGRYGSEDRAMWEAQDAGMLRPAADDEGGAPYACLDVGHEIRRVE